MSGVMSDEPKKQFSVGVSMHNCFTVEAETKEQAEDIVREKDLYALCDEMDFNITYIEEWN
tara:strand:+ start:4585 stop:4767 length:183 start_codon:yes stop_codon:yes gene_type:complete